MLWEILIVKNSKKYFIFLNQEFSGNLASSSNYFKIIKTKFPRINFNTRFLYLL